MTLYLTKPHHDLIGNLQQNLSIPFQAGLQMSFKEWLILLQRGTLVHKIKKIWLFNQNSFFIGLIKVILTILHWEKAWSWKSQDS